MQRDVDLLEVFTATFDNHSSGKFQKAIEKSRFLIVHHNCLAIYRIDQEGHPEKTILSLLTNITNSTENKLTEMSHQKSNHSDFVVFSVVCCH